MRIRTILECLKCGPKCTVFLTTERIFQNVSYNFLVFIATTQSAECACSKAPGMNVVAYQGSVCYQACMAPGLNSEACHGQMSRLHLLRVRSGTRCEFEEKLKEKTRGS